MVLHQEGLGKVNVARVERDQAIRSKSTISCHLRPELSVKVEKNKRLRNAAAIGHRRCAAGAFRRDPRREHLACVVIHARDMPEPAELSPRGVVIDRVNAHLLFKGLCGDGVPTMSQPSSTPSSNSLSNPAGTTLEPFSNSSVIT